ncbi:MAG: hypothetical protein K2L81_00390 [Muribaculaceae bacterium]|nr:hypothetical protein [Muribaculaceae bacterium]
MTQTNGPTLGYSPEAGAKIVGSDGLAFKSFSGADTIAPYEDWRLPAAVRAADLASRLSIDEIAGLMLYSQQNKIPMLAGDTYGGQPYNPDVNKPWDLTDGRATPSGLLPFEMPASMEAIESHCEDLPHDILPYTDTDGNTYTFGFGLDFTGPISDHRTLRYAPNLSK